MLDTLKRIFRYETKAERQLKREQKALFNLMQMQAADHQREMRMLSGRISLVEALQKAQEANKDVLQEFWNLAETGVFYHKTPNEIRELRYTLAGESRSPKFGGSSAN